jgi:sulfide dehydrogenase cytochrome subunit
MTTPTLAIVRCPPRRLGHLGAARRRHSMTHLPRIATAGLLVWVSLAHGQDGNLGRNLAATCASCHGTNGQVRGDTVTALAGMPAERIVTSFNGFKSGALPATIMHQIAKGYTDEQVKAIAAYFAGQAKK